MKEQLLKLKQVTVLIALIVLVSGCASIFLPRKENVTFKTADKQSTVYANNLEVGKGSTVTGRIKKDFGIQVVVKTPNYKDKYTVPLLLYRPIAYYPLFALSIATSCFIVMPAFVDYKTPQTHIYSRFQDVSQQTKYVKKTDKFKNISLTAIRLNIKDKSKDLAFVVAKYSRDNTNSFFDKLEKTTHDKNAKLDAKENKKNANKKTLNPDEKRISFDDTKFTDQLVKIIKQNGFVDTVNQVFANSNNTLLIEGSITKITDFAVRYKFSTDYYRSKVYMTWYMKNQFDEILDSIVTSEYSGDFCSAGSGDKYVQMLGDAVENSYMNLFSNKTFQKYVAVETTAAKPDDLLMLKKPRGFVTEVSDAATASVIIKNKDGHGSGFAITNDGYIITNYHVIAGKYLNKFNPLKVISDGEEYVATVVRYNRTNDIALLKIDKHFDKVFKMPTAKNFKNLQEVYTIGAPKSIELGQTVTSGLVSNERKLNSNYLLQLSMSVNFGNSGGPVFDKAGNLEGVIVSKLVGFSTEGIGFALPAFLIPDQLNFKFN